MTDFGQICFPRCFSTIFLGEEQELPICLLVFNQLQDNAAINGGKTAITKEIKNPREKDFHETQDI